MFKHFFFVTATLLCLCMQAPAQAGIVVSAVENVVGDTTSKTVTININAVSDGTPTIPLDPFNFNNTDLIGYYHFRVNLTGPDISGLSAAYNSTSVFSPLTEDDLDPGTAGVNPGISGLQVTFRAGSATNIELPTTGNNFIGSVTFTTTTNGNFNFSITPLNILASPLAGFARNYPNQVALEGVDHVLQSKVINVSGIVAVPEPSSIALIGIAIVGIGGFQLRRRSRALSK